MCWSRTIRVGRAHDGSRPRRRYGTVGADRIAHDLLLELPRQIELDPTRQRVAARKRDVEPPRRRRDGPALHQERHQNHDEAHVEIEMRVRQPDQQRDRGDENADGAAQADPGDEQLLAQAEAEGRETEEDRPRPRDQHQRRGHRERRQDRRRQAVRATTAGRAARTSRSARARSRHRGKRRPVLCARIALFPTTSPAM